jgi:enoyl-CoA hydratase/carnithine racemase
MFSEVRDRTATITLNRPEVLNCANEQWARDLNTLVDDLFANGELRVVVLRGAGRAFCSGIDLTAFSRGEIADKEADEPRVRAAVGRIC